MVWAMNEKHLLVCDLRFWEKIGVKWFFLRSTWLHCFVIQGERVEKTSPDPTYPRVWFWVQKVMELHGTFWDIWIFLGSPTKPPWFMRISIHSNTISFPSQLQTTCCFQAFLFCEGVFLQKNTLPENFPCPLKINGWKIYSLLKSFLFTGG